jgi:hypothetical protein
MINKKVGNKLSNKARKTIWCTLYSYNSFAFSFISKELAYQEF